MIGRTFGRDAAGSLSATVIELIRAFCSAMLGPGDAACITPPTFAEYEMAVLLAGARCTDESNGAAVRFLCNPNNPTGALHTRPEVLRLLAATAEQGAYLFLDEAFIELSDPGASPTSPMRTSSSCDP